MQELPKVKGIEWMFSTIAKVPVTFVNRKAQDMGLDIIPELPGHVYLDISKLAGVEPYYPDGVDEESPNICRVNIEGVPEMLVNIGILTMLEVWKIAKENSNK